MPVELQVLGYAVLLQTLQFLLVAIMVNQQLGLRYTAGPRDEAKETKGITGRIVRAHSNHFEALLLFSIAVVIVTLAEASTPLTQTCAWIYLLSRVLYIPAYASGIFMLRSLIWMIGYLATLIMLLVTLF